jgi:general secretion pathway protein I
MSRRGFTLIEVLAALAVIALAMSALLASSAQLARQQQQMESLTFASWMADTVMAETRLNEPFPGIGERDGDGSAGKYRFRWHMVVQATPEPTIRRIDLHVLPFEAGPNAAPLYSLIGFAGQ